MTTNMGGGGLVEASQLDPGFQSTVPVTAKEVAGVLVYVDRLTHFRDTAYVDGWAFSHRHEIVRIEYQFPGEASRPVTNWWLPSPDVEQAYGPRAAQCRFSARMHQEQPDALPGLVLVFTLEGGTRVRFDNLALYSTNDDPFHHLVRRFFNSIPDDAAVLEVGSRNRSGVVRTGWLPASASYIGFDVVAGENVDIVGDAHALSQFFEAGSFDAVFSMSTFEHLAMPWKVAVEMNQVLRQGGLALITSHQTWPLHEEPWDFWRFSDHSWAALFNLATGFKVVHTAMGEPASVVPHTSHSVVVALPQCAARLASAVICRKTGIPRVDWPVSLDEVLTSAYPH